MAIKKLYTENYVKAIADAIRAALGNPTAKYTISEMADIIKTNWSNWVLIKNWFRTWGENSGGSCCGMAYYSEDGQYGIVPLRGRADRPDSQFLDLGFIYRQDREHGGLYVDLDINNTVDSNWGHPSFKYKQSPYGNGMVWQLKDPFELFLPMINFDKYDYQLHDPGIYRPEVYENIDRLQFTGLSENRIHPILREMFKDEKVGYVKDIVSLKAKDLVNFSWDALTVGEYSKDHIKGIIALSGDLIAFIVVYDNQTAHDIGTFDSTTGRYSGVTGFYNRFVAVAPSGTGYRSYCWNYLELDDPSWRKNRATLLSGTGRSDLPNRILMNTVPILDENGEVVLEANCTLEDFGL